MSTRDAKGILHDELGRFTSKDGTSRHYAQNMSYGEIIKADREREKSRVKISLCFFAEKGLENQGPNQLRKGIKKKQEKIALHQWKIENPEKVYPEWESFSEMRRQRETNHWKQEIETHKKEILDREALIKEKEGKK